jgi:hypothetical protein
MQTERLATLWSRPLWLQPIATNCGCGFWSRSRDSFNRLSFDPMSVFPRCRWQLMLIR